MNLSVLIIGGGHAGISAALGAARAKHLFNEQVDITLVSQFENLTIRPRLYEYELEQTQIALSEILLPINVNLKIDTITSIDFKDKTAHGKTESYSFNTVIIATGSHLPKLPIPGLEKYSYNIDTFNAAMRYRQALTDLVKQAQADKLYRIAILGGGLTGIECATEVDVNIDKICKKYNYLKPSIEVVIIDKNQVSNNLGANPTATIESALKYCKVQCINNASITEITSDQVILSNKTINVNIVVSTLGLIAHSPKHDISFEKDALGRIQVNGYLQTPNHTSCFVVGDAAVTTVDNASHQSVISCQQARPQGRYAGYNAIANLSSKAMLKYEQPNYVTCMDLGYFGAVFTKGWDRVVELSGQEAKKLKQHINQDRIYPASPMTKEILMEEGKPEFIAPSN